MPRTNVIFYQDASGKVPVLDWLRDLKPRDRRAFAKCVVRIGRLADAGHELRRPEADHLRDGIHELRVRRGKVNYRVLYFFHGRDTAVLVHCCAKEGRVPGKEIARALRYRKAFNDSPDDHTYVMEV